VRGRVHDKPVYLVGGNRWVVLPNRGFTIKTDRKGESSAQQQTLIKYILERDHTRVNFPQLKLWDHSIEKRVSC